MCQAHAPDGRWQKWHLYARYFTPARLVIAMAACTAAACAYATFEPHSRLRRPFPRFRLDFPDDMFGTVTGTADNPALRRPEAMKASLRREPNESSK